MFDTLLGIIGLGYSFYSNSRTGGRIDALGLQMSEMREAISIMQRQINSLFSDAKMLRDINTKVDERVVHEISLQLFRRLEELTILTNVEPIIIIRDPRKVAYQVRDLSDDSTRVESALTPTLIIPSEYIRLPQLGRAGYEAIFSSHVKRVDYRLINPEPAYVRNQAKSTEKDSYWLKRLDEIAAPVEKECQFFLDDSYWREQLMSLKRK
jgi:hypothetical protein